MQMYTYSENHRRNHVWGFRPGYHVVATPNNAAQANARTARRHGGLDKVAYADTVVRMIIDDLRRGTGGGTYLMDGRSVRPGDGYYAVGGAVDRTEISVPEKNLLLYPETVQAATELLRDVVMDLEAQNLGGEIGIGFWVEDGEVFFDVSNLIQGRENAIEVAKERGELAIWDFANNENIYTAKRAGVVRGSDSHRKWNEYRKARNEAERRRLDGGRR